uniref:E2F/DP family winged-helix DNA-binding domain-containing protein n=1 Tax=Peronospora matthiolae TaxID=2874970 RepID=A0AAV1T6R7_9STRA
MKTQRVRRRKLRFGTAKADAAPSATVDRASKHPDKRRKRQLRSRRAPARLRSTVRCSPLDRAEGTWSHIQEQFTAAKSLGEITRIVLRFFMEHEDLQNSVSGAVFPIVVPSSEIYKMKVPRKRRIYDVLHVLEGIGVIKRVRCGETRKNKGGYFLYFGKTAVVRRLAEMKDVSAQAVKTFRQSCRPKILNRVGEDCAVVKVFETQAAVEKWPCLVTTTVCFLGLLFQQDYQMGVTLPAVSSRLIEAKKLFAVMEPSSPWIETPYNDVHRRVYDVMAVLVSCNMIDTSLGLSYDLRDKCFPRKHARFNYNIFTNPRVLFAFQDPGLHKRDDSTCESKFDIRDNSVFCSPVPIEVEDRLVSPPSAYWRSVQVNTTLAISPIFAPSVDEISDGRSNSEMANWKMLDYGASTQVTLQFGATSPSVQSESVTKCRSEGQSAPRIQDLFSPLGKDTTESNEWYDDSLKQLGCYDADQIDWDLTRQLKDTWHESWGSTGIAAIAPFTPTHASGWQFLIDKVEVKLVDLKVNKVEAEDVTAHSTDFLC